MAAANKITVTQTASYWQYTGNHPNGHDCPRNDPHGFGVKTISALHYLADEFPGVAVKASKSDGFGRVVTITASPQQWEAARQWVEAQEIN